MCRDTEREARRDYQEMVDNIDWEAIDYLTRVFGLEGQSYGDAESVRKLRTQFALLGWNDVRRYAGAGGRPTRPRVSDRHRRRHAGFLDYVVELEHFDRTVMPLEATGASAVKSALPRYELFIDGRHQPAASGKNYETTDPFAESRGPSCRTVTRWMSTAPCVRRALHWGPWGSMTGFDRARLLRALATILERDAEELARLETRDTGKLLREMGTQTKYLPQWFHYLRARPTKSRA